MKRWIILVCVMFLFPSLTACRGQVAESFDGAQVSGDVSNQDWEEYLEAIQYGSFSVIGNGEDYSLNNGELYYQGERVNPYIDYLEIHDAEFEDWSFMEEFLNLNSVYLSNCNISNLSEMSKSPSIKWLYLIDCEELADIAAVTEFSGLIQLEIRSCHNIEDFSVISNITSIETLILENCPGVTDLTFLSDLPMLTYLSLQGDCNIADFSPLKSIHTLELLNLIDTSFSNYDFPILDSLENLISLEIITDSITDYSYLLNMSFPNLDVLICGADEGVISNLEKAFPNCRIENPNE